MRRLYQGSAYYGAAVVPQSGTASAGEAATNIWGVFGAFNDGGGVAALRAPPVFSSDRWIILEPEITSSLPRASITMKELISKRKGSGSVPTHKSQHVGIDDMVDVVENWDKAYD
ncbi:hypothetical protein BC332_02017 [Capsicum chinense]|nr:hypothetical protein BC332_02017 [Capsicum chinense]